MSVDMQALCVWAHKTAHFPSIPCADFGVPFTHAATRQAATYCVAADERSQARLGPDLVRPIILTSCCERYEVFVRAGAAVVHSICTAKQAQPLIEHAVRRGGLDRAAIRDVAKACDAEASKKLEHAADELFVMGARLQGGDGFEKTAFGIGADRGPLKAARGGEHERQPGWQQRRRQPRW